MKSRGFVLLNKYAKAEHEDDDGTESIVITEDAIDGYIRLNKTEAIALVGFIQELWRKEFGL